MTPGRGSLDGDRRACRSRASLPDRGRSSPVRRCALENYRPRKVKSEDETKKYVARKLKEKRRKQMLGEWREKLLRKAKINIVHELLKGDSQ